MERNFIAVIFYICILLTACKDKEITLESVIKLNPNNAIKSIQLSEMVDSVSYIKLETSDSSIIGGRINRIIIKKKYIYAVDISQDILFVFDKNGHFVAKLDKLGEGPDEYSFMSHIFVDENEEYIDVVDGRESGARLLKYSNISFELLKDTPFYSPSANSSRREDNTYYFSTQQLENYVGKELTNADIIVVKDANIQKALFKKKIITEGNNFSANSESFTVNENGEIFISRMYSNTFYRLSDMDATPILTIDFGSYGIDNTIGLKSTQEQMRYLRDDTDGMAYFPVLNINNSNILAFSYYFKNHSKGRLHHYIQFNNSKKNIHVNEIINDLSSFPKKLHLSSYFSGINHEVYYENNYLVDIIVPSQYLEDRKSEIEVKGLGTIKAEDNPIIILMKLKEEITELR